MLEWRKLVCGVMIVIVPASLAGQDNGRAMLYSNGGTWLNGNPAPESSAIFPDAFIQTPQDHSAKIDAVGSTATVQPDTIVQFEGDELVLDHGSLQVSTARGMRVRVNCVTVIPITQDRTLYDVTDVDGKVKVVAYKNDVKIHYQGAAFRKSKLPASSDVIVREGEQTTREERCGAAMKPAYGGEGPPLNDTWVELAGIVPVAVITCYALCRSGKPVSPSKP